MFGHRHRDRDSDDDGHFMSGRRWRRHFGGPFGGRHGLGGGDMIRAGRMLATGDLRLIALGLILWFLPETRDKELEETARV